MRKILISGGNGFLGSHLAELALENKFEVVVVDDFSTSKDVNVPEGTHLVREKIEDYEDDTEYDYIVHLAARPSPEDYISNPISTILSNSLGTKKLLDMAVNNKAVFMYTSSSEVYGEASVIPTPESYYGYVNPNGLRSCYDESKRYSEALIMAYHRQIGIDVRIQRPFNVYGPRIRPDGQYGRVIPRFIMQALRNEPITVHGDGTQTRSFLYIKDWLKATWSFLMEPGLSGKVLNIGSDKQVTVNDLAREIVNLTGSRSKVAYLDRRIDDPTRRAANIDQIKSLIDWVPLVSLEQGLVETIDWVKERYK